jgi:hypothetical protein
MHTLALIAQASRIRVEPIRSNISQLGNLMNKLCILTPDYILQQCTSWFPLQGSASSDP